MKKQVTYEISEKPAFDNELDLKQTMQFLVKVEETVKLYNKHQKALKEYIEDIRQEANFFIVSKKTCKKKYKSNLKNDLI